MAVPAPKFHHANTNPNALNVFAAITVKLKLQENASSYLIGKGAFWLAVLFCLFIVFIYLFISIFPCDDPTLTSSPCEVLNKAGYGKTPEVRMNFCITLPKEAKRGTPF